MYRDHEVLTETNALKSSHGILVKVPVIMGLPSPGVLKSSQGILGQSPRILRQYHEILG
jgi:hypothetical protein